MSPEPVKWTPELRKVHPSLLLVCSTLISCVNIQHTDFPPKKKFRFILIIPENCWDFASEFQNDVSAPGLSPPRFAYWSRGSNHQPSQLVLHTPGRHCEDYVFHSHTTSWEDDMTAGQSPCCVLDYWLPERQTAWRAPAELCAIQGWFSHTGVPQGTVLSLQHHTPLDRPNSEVDWGLCHRWVYQQGWWDWGQVSGRRLCHIVWEELSSAQHDRVQGIGCGPKENQGSPDPVSIHCVDA